MNKQAHSKTARIVAASLVVAATASPAAAQVDHYRPLEAARTTTAGPSVGTAGDQMPTGTSDLGCRPATNEENLFTSWLRKLLTRLFK